MLTGYGWIRLNLGRVSVKHDLKAAEGVRNEGEQRVHPFCVYRFV